MGLGDLTVRVLRAPVEGGVESQELRLPAASTVGDALATLGWTLGEAESVGVWGRKVALTEALRDGDRVEVYRPLTVDPMLARHRRHALQGGRRIVSRHRPAGPKTG